MTDLRTELQTTLGTAYTIERELGGGGMSRVFVADETRLQRKVVVKVLSPELVQGFSLERFEREIRTAAALQQANIVPVLSASDMNGIPYYTMPFVEGESLRVRLARGPLSITEVLNVVRDVSKALAYAHRQGIVHRDIKPDNVLLSEGTAVVTDFGIAKAISVARTGPGATLTSVGTSIGTPAYMAPEQAAGDPDVDHRADIYSLGAMAYELISGQHVFAGRTPQRMMAAHMTEPPQPVTEFRTDIPAPLAELVMSCLAKDANQRPQSAADITRVLETITSGGGMQSMPPVLLGGPGMFRKALAMYAAAFVVVAIVARAAIIGIGLPEWVFAGSLVVMALGLPVILVTGYVQRVTRRVMLTTPTYTPGGTPSKGGTFATLALRAAPHVSWYRTARGGIYAMGTFILLIGLVMATRALGVGPFASLRAAGRLNQRDQVLLTDFRTTNADSALGRVVSDAVRAGLAGSRAFTLVQPNAIVAALQRMEKPPTTRVDSSTARQIAQREGYKAIVDGDITGVTGGYIVAIRLVRADSGVQLASFLESGDGPRGLIDAADKLARALRSKAGESLRDVNATPPLFQATTASIEALQKYSESIRANARGDRRAIDYAREAVAIDSTFASAWNVLGAALSNYGAPRSARDSALTQAYRHSQRLSDNERDRIVARYYSLGPGRDRSRAIAAYEVLIQQGDSFGTLVNLGEQLRSRRQFARAESLNVATFRSNALSGTALGNAVEMQLNLGKLDEAEKTADRLREVSYGYGAGRRAFVLFAKGDDRGVRALIDSMVARGPQFLPFARNIRRSLALRGGRLNEFRAIQREIDGSTMDGRATALEAQVMGRSPQLSARLDSAVMRIRFNELPEPDRPYLDVAYDLAKMGGPAKARAMVARYRAELTDTSLVRDQEHFLHTVLGEIALAENKPLEAIAEFRRGDVGYDGAPAHECAPCLPERLARAFEAAGQADSAITMYEQYLATPFWLKADRELDPVLVPKIRERLGQLYETVGNTEKAAANYRAFVDLWRNADPELQPRVAAAREKLRRMSLDAPRR